MGLDGAPFVLVDGFQGVVAALHVDVGSRDAEKPDGPDLGEDAHGIDAGERFQVKRIMVKPGEKISLQMHHHRAEHWVVVSGTAKVTVEGKEILVCENQSTYIPLGQTHRLENPGKLPLHLIEVQSGAYLGEDDIVRFEDNYGRSAKPFK